MGGMGRKAGGWSGRAARNCTVAASPIAEPQACGTHSTPKALARVAILRHSEKPPAAHRSGWTMSIALWAMMSRKPQRVKSFSPPATAMSSARVTSM